MKNKKLLRAIAALTVGSAMAAGCLSFTACGGGHTHTWSDDYYADGANGHYQICTDCDEHSDNEAHTMVDGECTVCHWKSPSTGGEEDDDDDKTPDDDDDDDNNNDNDNDNNPVEDKSVVISFDSIEDASIADSTELAENSGVYASGALTVSSAKKSVTYKGSKVDVTNRITLNKAIGEDGTTALKVHLEDDATVVVYSYCSTNGTERFLTLYDAEKAEISGTKQSIDAGNNIMGVAMFDVEADKDYYIGCSGGMYIYYIVVSYNAINETKNATHVDEADATCTNKGVAEHYISDYGRYYTESNGEYTLTQYCHLYTDDATGHDYSTGKYTVTNPTADVEGKAVITCVNSCGTTTEVVLPILSSEKYTRTAVDGDGTKYTYTFNDPVTGATISFEDVKVEEVKVVLEPQTVTASDYVESFDAGSAIDNMLLKLEFSANITVAKDYSDAVSSDAKTFSYGFLPNGGSTSAQNNYTVTAKEDITLTVYYTSTDSKFTTLDQSKAGDLTYSINGTETTSATGGNKSNKTAYVETISLKAGDVLKLYASSNRLVLFGLYAAPVEA